MNSNFTNKLKEQGFLIIAHRGTWGGNIIQNTREASILSYVSGADVVEIDVSRTKDGEYYLFHDGNELNLLGKDKHFSEWSSEEIDSTQVINTTLTPSGYYLEKLEEYLEWLPAGKLINIDRAWQYFDDPKFFEILQESNKTDQVFLKSPVEEKYLDIIEQKASKIPYMPIIKEKEEFETVLEYENINLIGLEVLAPSKAHELYNKEWLVELNNQGFIVLGNAIYLGPSQPLFSNLTDDSALFDTSVNNAWGQMLDMGVNMIQTDWPLFLNQYRSKVYNTEKTSV